MFCRDSPDISELTLSDIEITGEDTFTPKTRKPKLPLRRSTSDTSIWLEKPKLRSKRLPRELKRRHHTSGPKRLESSLAEDIDYGTAESDC